MLIAMFWFYDVTILWWRQTTDLSNAVQFEGAETVCYKTWLCYRYGE